MQTLLPCPHRLCVQSAFSADPLTVPPVQSTFNADSLTVSAQPPYRAQSPCAVSFQCELSYRVRTGYLCSQHSVQTLLPCPVCSQLSEQTLLPCLHSPRVQSAFSANSLTVSAQPTCADSFQCRLSYRVRIGSVCSQLSVQTLLPCPRRLCVQLHASTFVHTLKIPNTCRHYTIVWTHLPYTHTDSNGYKRFPRGCCA